MPRFPVIGLTGPARSGKDTATRLIIGQYGGYRYGLADPIKAMVKVLGVDDSDPYWQQRKEDIIPALGVSPRRIYQTLGTDWGRNIINHDIWVILAHQKLLSSGPGMVISDVRFDNEAKWIRAQKGLVIHISRDARQKVEEHVSEQGVERNPSDMFIDNNSTIEDLQQRLQERLDGYF